MKAQNTNCGDPPMYKPNLKQPIKEKIAKAKAKLHQYVSVAKLRLKKTKLNFQASVANTKIKIKNTKPKNPAI